MDRSTARQKFGQLSLASADGICLAFPDGSEESQ
jgi:hypothetical protein